MVYGLFSRTGDRVYYGWCDDGVPIFNAIGGLYGHLDIEVIRYCSSDRKWISIVSERRVKRLFHEYECLEKGCLSSFKLPCIQICFV